MSDPKLKQMHDQYNMFQNTVEEQSTPLVYDLCMRVYDIIDIRRQKIYED